jgi:hypothetical protein
LNCSGVEFVAGCEFADWKDSEAKSSATRQGCDLLFINDSGK